MAVKRLLAVSIDGKERIVEVGDDGGVCVDGQPVDVAVSEAEAGVWILRRGNEQAIAQVDGRGGKLTVELRRPGRDAVVVATEVRDARRGTTVTAARAAAGAAPVTMRSPIPGRLIKLLVKTGDAVAAGQTVVVLEAMKMENELTAPRAGRVAEVRCAEGAAVEAGQDLVIVA
ncbi:MAG TPA: biotin/lipoyl-containing protein [Polyangia bacterium]|jgi:biotin carboxyl carrier protein